MRPQSYTIDQKRVVAPSHGPYARVRWAVEVIRLWKAYCEQGITGKDAVYPEPPRTKKRREKRRKYGNDGGK